MTFGRGPQEDELRYLADFLGLGGHVRFLMEETSDDESQAPNMLLDISDALVQGWRLTRAGELTAHLSFGEVARLEEIVEALTS